MTEENKGVEEKCLIQPKDDKEKLEDENSNIEKPKDQVFFILSDDDQSPPFQVNKLHGLELSETITFNPGEHVVVDTGVRIILPPRMSMMFFLRFSLQNAGLSLMGVSFNPESHALQIKLVNTTTIPVQVTPGCAIVSVFFYDGYIYPHIAQKYGIAVNAKAISKDHIDSIKKELQDYSDGGGYNTSAVLLERVI